MGFVERPRDIYWTTRGATESVHKRLAQQSYHPEYNEGLLRTIFRQVHLELTETCPERNEAESKGDENDTSEGVECKVGERFVL